MSLLRDIEVDTSLLEKGKIRLRQWTDDRNGVRIQENVRISLYSGGALEGTYQRIDVVNRIRRPGGEVPYV
jgi:hypothetical protein